MIIKLTNIVEEKTSRGSKYLKIKGIGPDGQETTKSVFDNLKDKWPLLIEGATLDFKLEKKGEYWNVVGIEEVGLPPAEKATGLAPVVIEKEHEYVEAARQLSIIRQSSLKAAVELVVPFVVGGKVADSNTAADVALKLAERFEAWVKRG